MSHSSIATLARSLGRRQAELECKWMRRSAANQTQLSQMVKRRIQGEPLQYILGTQPFGPLDIIVRPPVLIPRPETEQWSYTLVDKIIDRFSFLSGNPETESLTILDLCTGTGCIPLLLCILLKSRGVQTEAIGVDISSEACRLAQENIISAKSRFPILPPIRILQKDLFESNFWTSLYNTLTLSNHSGLPRQFDIITINPPYIPADRWQQLPPEVKAWEDPVALLGDPPFNDSLAGNLPKGLGLTFYRQVHDLIASCPTTSPSFILALEIGEDQATAVANLFRHQFCDVQVWKDGWGKDRAVFCTKKQ